MRRSIFIFIFAAVSFFAGYAASTRSHGDWLVLRTDAGQCVAYDPDSMRMLGTWSVRGRCHMADFVWRQIVIRPLRGWK